MQIAKEQLIFFRRMNTEDLFAFDGTKASTNIFIKRSIEREMSVTTWMFQETVLDQANREDIISTNRRHMWFT